MAGSKSSLDLFQNKLILNKLRSQQIKNGQNKMSLEQIDLQSSYDRNELNQLTIKQLCTLLSISVKQLKDFDFSKDNLIEMFLTKQPEL